ncbi:hypothetical protein IT400_03280 [Candidatus Nomurabacteria bacterium]|nr:hypothetical protein [Candidatus Nomurabacteria bacterium]
MIQTIEMKAKMYNKIKKDRLIEMLIEANNHINELIIAKRNVEEICQHKMNLIKLNSLSLNGNRG